MFGCLDVPFDCACKQGQRGTDCVWSAGEPAVAHCMVCWRASCSALCVVCWRASLVAAGGHNDSLHVVLISD